MKDPWFSLPCFRLIGVRTLPLHRFIFALFLVHCCHRMQLSSYICSLYHPTQTKLILSIFIIFFLPSFPPSPLTIFSPNSCFCCAGAISHSLTSQCNSQCSPLYKTKNPNAKNLDCFGFFFYCFAFHFSPSSSSPYSADPHFCLIICNFLNQNNLTSLL